MSTPPPQGDAELLSKTLGRRGQWSLVVAAATGRGVLCRSLGLKHPQWVLAFFFGSDQDELAWPAHFTVLEITSRDQGMTHKEQTRTTAATESRRSA